MSGDVSQELNDMSKMVLVARIVLARVRFKQIVASRQFKSLTQPTKRKITKKKISAGFQVRGIHSKRRKEKHVISPSTVSVLCQLLLYFREELKEKFSC